MIIFIDKYYRRFINILFTLFKYKLKVKNTLCAAITLLLTTLTRL